MRIRAAALLACMALLAACCDYGKPSPPEPEGSAEGQAAQEGEGTREGLAEGAPEGAIEGEGAAPGVCETDCIYEIVHSYPHDPEAFTQGLVFDNSVLYEGTGLYGHSTLRKVDLDTGSFFQAVDLPANVFGEGITLFGDKVIQLTWREKTGYVYDKASFQLLQQFAYDTEGWGLTHDGARLIMSDGSSTLYFLDPITFARTGSLSVRYNGRAVNRLNELEYVNGEILANIWQEDRVARIAPDTGRVKGWINLGGLLTAEERASADVLNGIAYDVQGGRLFVTGKLWPKLFEIRLLPKP